MQTEFFEEVGGVRVRAVPYTTAGPEVAPHCACAFFDVSDLCDAAHCMPADRLDERAVAFKPAPGQTVKVFDLREDSELLYVLNDQLPTPLHVLAAAYLQQTRQFSVDRFAAEFRRLLPKIQYGRHTAALGDQAIMWKGTQYD